MIKVEGRKTYLWDGTEVEYAVYEDWMAIEDMVLWKKEMAELVEGLIHDVMEYLPVKYTTKIEGRVTKIVLGETIPKFGRTNCGVYTPGKRKISLTPYLLRSMDPSKITSGFFHELGHPLLNDEFTNLDEQVSADFLCFYSLDDKYDRDFREDVADSKKYYEKYQHELEERLGNNNELVRKNLKLIHKTTEKWAELLNQSRLAMDYGYHFKPQDYHLVQINKVDVGYAGNWKNV